MMVGNMKKKGVDVICVEEKKLAYTMADREINAIPCSSNVAWGAYGWRYGTYDSVTWL
ncbi:hypothetical protein HanIR_Chr16g0845451 [Helianthus annuus]|nr:hypothetical protein HanIR_Chr16g0845451 [Helianthus annuus]